MPVPYNYCNTPLLLMGKLGLCAGEYLVLTPTVLIKTGKMYAVFLGLKSRIMVVKSFTMKINTIKKKALRKKPLTRKECAGVLDYPDENLLELLDAAYSVRKKYLGNKVQVQVLLNAKSGLCSEDCKYCTQSAVSGAEIKEYPLRPAAEIVQGARAAKKSGATRYCIALSSIRYADSLIDDLAAAIRQVKEKVKISMCCSMGFLTMPQALKLKKAGLDRINHNLNTSKKYYPKICTTHKYGDRLKNISICREAGLEICSGGIIGLGESREDVIDMLLELKELKPDSMPINFLIPAEGTPLAKGGAELTPQYCLKVLCLARFINPDQDIRAAGGREYRLRSLQGLALYPANSIFVSGYLTAGGQPAGEGIQMIKDMGFEVEIEGVS
jgi:biotin synthase